MRQRLESLLAIPRGLTKQGIPIGTAMKRTLQSGYGWKEARADAMAGIVVGIVALPLSMALAIGVGAPPQHGLYTAVVAGIVIAVLALIPVVGYLEAVLVPALAARLRRRLRGAAQRTAQPVPARSRQDLERRRRRNSRGGGFLPLLRRAD